MDFGKRFANASIKSSMVPDRLEFEGRLGVPVGAGVAEARHAFEAVVARALDDGDAPAEITWEGGSFAPAETPPDHPLVTGVAAAFADELGREVRPAAASRARWPGRPASSSPTPSTSASRSPS